MNEVRIGEIRIGKGNPLVLIAGPCVLEGEAIAMETAKGLKELCEGLKIPLIFKASYEKDNRGSEKSYNGPGLKEGLRILAKVKEKRGHPCPLRCAPDGGCGSGQGGSRYHSNPSLSLSTDKSSSQSWRGGESGQY